jgi:hypothetical protein
VLEEFIRAEIQDHGTNEPCSYCTGNQNTFPIERLADRVRTVLAEHFRQTSSDPVPAPNVPEEEWRREGQPVAAVIQKLAQVGRVAADDIRLVLAERPDDTQDACNNCEEAPFDDKAHYVQMALDAWDLHADWLLFEKSLKRHSRFFNPIATNLLTSVFEGIHQHKTVNGRHVIVTAGPGTDLTQLYRARVFQSVGNQDDEKKLRKAMQRPDQELGPPPPSSATAGRMNAAGIAVFYGAADPNVALAELRPPVGSKVLIARFELIRPLILLDLTALEFITSDKGSPFDSSYVERSKKVEFLRTLNGRMARLIMPQDQLLDYLPTQVVAEFLAAEVDPSLDGIIYQSFQVGDQPFGVVVDRRNVVIFRKAARVQALDISQVADISVSTNSFIDDWGGILDDAPDLKYLVVEKLLGGRLEGSEQETQEPDEASLKFSELEVHYVKGVKFQTDTTTVRRYRV